MWGTSFLFTRIALDTIPPTGVVAARLGLAAACLIGVAAIRGLAPPRGAAIWLHLALLSLLGNTLPFSLIAWGQQSIDSGLAAMLLAGMPLSTLVLAHFLVAGERMTAAKTIGFVVGLLGIAILVGPDALASAGGDRRDLLSQAAVVAAALCYSCNAILARYLPEDGDPVVHTAATVALAFCTTLPIALADQTAWLGDVDFSSLFSIAWLGLISTAAATVLYFRIIASAGPTFLSLINYLIPPIAIVAGATVLGERPEATAMIALGVVLAGIAISQRHG